MLKHEYRFENVQPDDIFLENVIVIKKKRPLLFPCGHPKVRENMGLRSDRSIGYKCLTCERLRAARRREQERLKRGNPLTE